MPNGRRRTCMDLKGVRVPKLLFKVNIDGSERFIIFFWILIWRVQMIKSGEKINIIDLMGLFLLHLFGYNVRFVEYLKN